MKTRKLNIKSTILSVLLLIAVLCTTITGCGSNNPGDTQSSISSEVESSSQENTSGETETESKPVSTPTAGNKGDSTEDTEIETESETQNNNTDTNTNQGTTNNNTNTGNTGTTNNNTNNNSNTDNTNNTPNAGQTSTPTDFNTLGISLSQIPAYSGTDYITLNNGTPHFSTSNLSTTAFEYYSELDSLGRCGVTYACLGPELLPTEERGDINSVTPSGWVSSEDSGNSLYNRSHLIAFSLAGENDNEKNLITGTSHMNQYTMQIFENQVLDYIKEGIENKKNLHVMYRVTPFFEGNNLVATGVQMEAWSIEDNGASICFNVFCYNVQEGVSIDYATGNYSLEETNYLYIVNGKNGKIHTYACGIKSNMSNPIYCETLEEAIAESEKILGTAVGAGCCKPLP